MQLNVAKTAQQNLLDLMNAANTQTLTLADMTMGAPVVYDDPTDVNTRNTQVTISALQGSEDYKGSQTLRYTRLDVETLVGASYEFQSVEGSTLADVLAAVVADKGLIAADVELVEAEMPDWTDEMIDGETAPLTLRAKNGSYAYIGEVTISVVEPVDGRERFATMYSVVDLDGFDAPEAE